MKRKIFLLISIAFLLALSFSFVKTTLADDKKAGGETGAVSKAGGDTTKSGEPVTLDNPLGEGITAQKLIGRVINGLLGIVGSLALVMFIYGGFMWMTAAGAADKIEKGKQTIMWATIGLIVIFSSYALVQFVIDAIGA